jgi:hypothetical protein
LDFIYEGLEDTALVENGRGPVFFKLNNQLEAESGGGDLWLEDPNKVGDGGFCKVNNDWLQSNGIIGLLTNLFGKRGASDVETGLDTTRGSSRGNLTTRWMAA